MGHSTASHTVPSTPCTARIVCIDDDRSLNAFHRALLEAALYTVQTASTGEEGLRRARQQCTDLILLDHKLPDISGFEVLRRLRAEGSDIPAVLLTGWPDQQ